MRLARRGAGFALALLFFELILRWLGYGGEAVDARNGAIPPDGATLRSRTGEGWATSRWQPDGTRVVPGELLSGPPVVALGDSFTQALQVEDDEVFTARLQHALGVPVLNRGCGACSPADYVARAQSVRAHNAAWTVVQLNPPDLYGDAFSPDRMHFVERGGGLELVLAARRERAPLIETARRQSALVDYGMVRAGMLRRASKLPPLFLAGDELRIPEGVPTHLPPSPHVEDLLGAMSTAFEQRVTFFYIPAYIEDPATSGPYIDRRAEDVERRFDRWCAASSASCVNLRDAFPSFARVGRAPTGFANSRFGRGHLNREGHAASAELLARELGKIRRRGLF